MGSTTSAEKTPEAVFARALENKSRATLKEIASTEVMNDGTMLNEAVRREQFDMVKFLVESCSTVG